MSDKLEVEVKVRLFLNKDRDIDLDQIIQEMDYSFVDTTTKAEIEDTEILDFRIVNSR